MTGRTHAVIGANTVWLLSFTTIPLDPLYMPVGAFVALLPDLDASESTIKHFTLTVGRGRDRISIKPFWPVAMAFSTLFRHRGWFHSLVAIIGVGLIATWALGSLGPGYPLIVILAYASHLISDGLTKSGIGFLLPIPLNVHFVPKPMRIRTGGMVDLGLFVLGMFGIVAFYFQYISQSPSI